MISSMLILSFFIISSSAGDPNEDFSNGNGTFEVDLNLLKELCIGKVF